MQDYEFVEFAENDEYDWIFKKNLSYLFVEKDAKKPYLLLKNKTIDNNFLSTLLATEVLRNKYFKETAAKTRWSIIPERIVCFAYIIFENCKFENIDMVKQLIFGVKCVLINCKFNKCKFIYLKFDQNIINKLTFNNTNVLDKICFNVLYDIAKFKFKRKKWNFEDILFIKDIYIKRCSIPYIISDLMFKSDEFKDLNNYLMTNIIPNMTIKIPSKGNEMYGYKVVRYNDNSDSISLSLIKVLIPKNADRIITIENICRATEVIPVKVYNVNGNERKSKKYNNMIFFPLFMDDGIQYQLNKKSTTLSGFNNYVCDLYGAGINFFLTKKEAIEYALGYLNLTNK